MLAKLTELLLVNQLNKFKSRFFAHVLFVIVKIWLSHCSSRGLTLMTNLS